MFFSLDFINWLHHSNHFNSNHCCYVSIGFIQSRQQFGFFPLLLFVCHSQYWIIFPKSNTLFPQWFLFIDRDSKKSSMKTLYSLEVNALKLNRDLNRIHPLAYKIENFSLDLFVQSRVDQFLSKNYFQTISPSWMIGIEACCEHIKTISNFRFVQDNCDLIFSLYHRAQFLVENNFFFSPNLFKSQTSLNSYVFHLSHTRIESVDGFSLSLFLQNVSSKNLFSNLRFPLISDQIYLKLSIFFSLTKQRMPIMNSIFFQILLS